MNKCTSNDAKKNIHQEYVNRTMNWLNFINLTPAQAIALGGKFELFWYDHESEALIEKPQEILELYIRSNSVTFGVENDPTNYNIEEVNKELVRRNTNPISTVSVTGAWGTLTVQKETGVVLDYEATDTQAPEFKESSYKSILAFDLEEWQSYWKRHSLDTYFDICDLKSYSLDYGWEPADQTFRDEQHYQANEWDLIVDKERTLTEEERKTLESAPLNLEDDKKCPVCGSGEKVLDDTLRNMYIVSQVVEDNYGKLIMFPCDISVTGRADLAVKLTKEFTAKYPLGYDWEEHRENGGGDWDEEITKFVLNHIQ